MAVCEGAHDIPNRDRSGCPVLVVYVNRLPQLDAHAIGHNAGTQVGRRASDPRHQQADGLGQENPLRQCQRGEAH